MLHCQWSCLFQDYLNNPRYYQLKNVGILYHPHIESTSSYARQVADLLSGEQIGSWVCSSWQKEKILSQIDGTDLIICIGGDGTILRCAQALIDSGVPITGINFGKLGFLTELTTTEVPELLPQLLNGKGWLDERCMLQVSLEVETGEDVTYHALNDIVLARGSVVRVVNIEAVIDGVEFTRYTADGVLLATATGSTGYALAAGGPIIYPQAKDILLVPILPHLNLDHSLLLPPESVIRLKVNTPFDATLSIDGQTNLSFKSGSSVTIRRSPYCTSFLRIHPKNSFFSTLEGKLKGKRNVKTSS